MRLIDADRFEAFCYDVPMDCDEDSFMRGVEFVLGKIDAAPTIQPDWNEMIIICDCCGHTIHVKRQ